MSTTDTDADSNSSSSSESLTTAQSRTNVTEVWPGRFALEIETGGKRGGISTTTTFDLDAEQLRALSERIDTALENAHRQ